MESLIVTGSYAPEARITASSTVLNTQQIQALNKKTLGQVLKTIPGLLVEEQGGQDDFHTVSVRAILSKVADPFLRYEMTSIRQTTTIK
jgi:vitamin B12 transporter